MIMPNNIPNANLSHHSSNYSEPSIHSNNGSHNSLGYI